MMSSSEAKRVLLVSKDSREAIRLSNLISDNGNAVVHVVDDLNAAESLKGKKYGIDLMVLRQSKVEFEARFPDQILEFADRFPTLILSEAIPEGILQRAGDEENIRFLHMPSDDVAVVKICRRLAAKHKLPQQIHKRFNTDQIAEIEVYGSGEMSRALLRNLSKSGAFLEYQNRLIDFSKGDLLQMTIQLDELKKVRTVNAEVVWVGSDGTYSNGLGIHFINGDEVFNKLMARL